MIPQNSSVLYIGDENHPDVQAMRDTECYLTIASMDEIEQHKRKRYDVVCVEQPLEKCHNPQVSLKHIVKAMKAEGHLILPPEYLEWVTDYGLRIEYTDQRALLQLERHKFMISETGARCNLRCKYCYAKHGGLNRYPPEKWQIFLKQHQDMRWIINLCSTGETFLIPEIINIIQKLVNHRNTLMLATNMSVPNVDNILDVNPEYFFLLFSVHWDELIKRGLLKSTLQRARRLAENGCSISPIVVLTDRYIKLAEEISTRVMDETGLRVGAKIRQGLRNQSERKRDKFLTPKEREICDKYYVMTWHDAEIKRTDIQGTYCNAGEGVVYFNPKGQALSCGVVRQQLGTFDKFEFKPVGICPRTRCGCPMPLMCGCVRDLTPSFDECALFNGGPESLQARMSIEIT